jgi:hypothetical protein
MLEQTSLHFRCFRTEQREWLDRMAEHIATSLAIQPADFASK